MAPGLNWSGEKEELRLEGSEEESKRLTIAARDAANLEDNSSGIYDVIQWIWSKLGYTVQRGELQTFLEDFPPALWWNHDDAGFQ